MKFFNTNHLDILLKIKHKLWGLNYPYTYIIHDICVNYGSDFYYVVYINDDEYEKHKKCIDYFMKNLYQNNKIDVDIVIMSEILKVKQLSIYNLLICYEKFKNKCKLILL